MNDNKEKDPYMLHAVMADGRELDIPIDHSQMKDRGFGECKLTELLGGPLQDEISITVRITYEEIGTWLADQCRQLLNLEEKIEISYEIDTKCDFVCYIRPSSGPVTEISVNLYHAMGEIYSLLRYVGGWAELIDAGFKILDSSCINNNDSEGYIDYTLFGFVNKLSAD